MNIQSQYLNPHITTTNYASEKSILKSTIIQNLKSTTQINIDLMDFPIEMISRIYSNFMSYHRLILEILDELLIESSSETCENVFIRHRLSRLKEKFPDQILNNNLLLPPQLLRSYHLTYTVNTDTTMFNDLTSNKIGNLVAIKGIVTRVSIPIPKIEI